MAREPFNPDLAIGGAGPPAPPRDSQRIFTVAEITQHVKDAIERALPPTVHVVGEISNCKRHSSGHLYCTLKDDTSELACVMWRSDAVRLKFKLEDGCQVVVTGSISVFERSGRYQLYARRIEPRGVGAIELAFRQLCEKLRKEGLFDARHKQDLPPYPQRIAVVTSPTGAAVKDILDTLARRYPCAVVLLCPVVVQGPGAPASLVRALRALDRRREEWGGIDVIIMGRGGGSAEDLAAFNDESVARAIFASRIPIISAVGHETDVTIADLVADVRAATPTAAAELATPRVADVLDEFAYRTKRLTRALRHMLDLRTAELATTARRRPFADAVFPIRDRRERVAHALRELRSATQQRVHKSRLRVHELVATVHRLHPQRFVAQQNSRLMDVWHRLEHGWATRVRSAERSLTTAEGRLLAVSPRRELIARGAYVAALSRRLEFALKNGMKRSSERLSANANRIAALSYRATLARGYSITRSKRSGKVIQALSDVRADDRVVTEIADGKFESRVLDDQQSELFD